MTRTNMTGIDLSLARIAHLLTRLGSPQTRFPIIHVAGTNAKGSTIHHLDALLRTVVGLRTASFTSPHLREERDACKVNGRVVEPSVWQQATRRVEDAERETASEDDAQEACTPFERLTARCFVAFDLLQPAQRPDVLLIEVGLGGALDATNVFTARQVLASVIGAIDFDHQALLGDTLGEIARHKAGIIKQGGLCILADQRRGAASQDTEADCTRVTANAAAEGWTSVVETVRQTCVERQARLVQAYTPWQVLEAPTSDAAGASAWAAFTDSHVRYAPILSLSKARAGDYVAATGDGAVPGPTLHLPATRAALMGVHLALQTLWSIARDETPCGLGADGADAAEEIRLQIAFALRDEMMAKRAIASCVQDAHQLAGRAEWVDLKVAPVDEVVATRTEEAQTTGEEEHSVVEKSQPKTITALVDGAHNPAAAAALRQYVDACIKQRGPPSVTVTWILALSRGKALEEMADALFSVTDAVGSMSLSDDANPRIEHRVACVPFTTPVEGMPWVQCVPPEELADALRGSSVKDVQPFTSLQTALQWAAHDHDDASKMIVIAGSLYLVSDVHRLH